MDIIKQIELLHKQGIGIKAIARQLGISKNTVKSYLNVQNKHPDTKPSSKVPERSTEQLESFFAYCKEELDRKGVTRQILWVEKS